MTDKNFLNIAKQAPVGMTVIKGSDFIMEMANHKYLEIDDRMEHEVLRRSLFHSLPQSDMHALAVSECKFRNMVNQSPILITKFRGKEYSCYCEPGTIHLYF